MDENKDKGPSWWL